MASDELRALRAEAQRRHKAATRKVSRLKTQRGVQLSGTRADPRRNRGNIKNYNRAQLRAYINELNSFTSRRTQFVPDAEGRPMSASTWKQYKQLESRYNARVDQRFEKYADIELPYSGMTLKQRMEMTRPEFPQALSPAVNVAYKPPERAPQNMRDERALGRMVASMRQRLSPRHFDKLTKDAREQYAKMSSLVSQPELDKRVAQLSDEQFMVLWNYTPFATAESFKYEHAKNLLSDKEAPWEGQVAEQATQNALELAEWAGTLDLGR